MEVQKICSLALKHCRLASFCCLLLQFSWLVRDILDIIIMTQLSHNYVYVRTSNNLQTRSDPPSPVNYNHYITMRKPEDLWEIAIMYALSCTLLVSCLQTLLTHTREMSSSDKTDQASTLSASLHVCTCMFEIYIASHRNTPQGHVLVWIPVAVVHSYSNSLLLQLTTPTRTLI